VPQKTSHSYHSLSKPNPNIRKTVYLHLFTTYLTLTTFYYLLSTDNCVFGFTILDLRITIGLRLYMKIELLIYDLLTTANCLLPTGYCLLPTVPLPANKL